MRTPVKEDVAGGSAVADFVGAFVQPLGSIHLRHLLHHLGRGAGAPSRSKPGPARREIKSARETASVRQVEAPLSIGRRRK